MAWRIDEHVVRGEIDNRTRGRVTGRIWFAGRAEPVELDLAGNAWRDLAGRRLEFVNPDPKPGLAESFPSPQRGVVGDITASRKVRVPDIPLAQIGEYYAARKPFPWHWGNSLYLEWHSNTNGRVVIETASFKLTIDPEAAWEMDEAEEREQRIANEAALQQFIRDLCDAAESTLASPDATSEEPAANSADAADAGWRDEDEDRPQTEAEADAMLEDSDRLADRLALRLEREGPDADLDQILAEELERRRAQRNEPPLTPEEEAERERHLEALNRAAEEALDDPEIHEIVSQKHPLAARAQELAFRLARESDQHGWISETMQEEHPVAALINATMRAAAKLAGALHGREWPPTIDECGMAIAWLKRARGFLSDALAAADACRTDQLTETAWLAEVHAELDATAAEVDAIIADLRAKLDRGFD